MKFKLKALGGSPRSTKVASHWPSLISQQNRRITGVTPRVTRAYSAAPAKFIPRSKGLLSRMAGKGAGKKEAVKY